MACRACGNSTAVDVSSINFNSVCPGGSDGCPACAGIEDLRREVKDAADRLNSVLKRLEEATLKANYAHSLSLHRQTATQVVAILEDVLIRSRQAPLTICIHSQRVERMARGARLSLPSILSTLGQQSERWHNIDRCLPLETTKSLFNNTQEPSRSK
ncbi:hypothetical protein CPC08DRAFT_295299 [Agrocybe pediades]|nr:hypothetical protein CPC08DRAFT_295299 [Agrocybe pediades]